MGASRRSRRYFSANSHVSHMNHPATRAIVGTMQNDQANDPRIRARDAATRMLNRITAGVAFGAIAGVGLVGAVSAYTIPGVVSSTQGSHRRRLDILRLGVVERSSVVANLRDLVVGLWRRRLRRVLVPVRR
jgi:hypothetical protein